MPGSPRNPRSPFEPLESTLGSEKAALVSHGPTEVRVRGASILRSEDASSTAAWLEQSAIAKCTRTTTRRSSRSSTRWRSGRAVLQRRGVEVIGALWLLVMGGVGVALRRGARLDTPEGEARGQHRAADG